MNADMKSKLRLYDVIRDEDAYINGIVVGIHEDSFNILWANNVLGMGRYSDESLILTGMSATEDIERILDKVNPDSLKGLKEVKRG